MSVDDESDRRSLPLLAVGEMVILRDALRGTVEEVVIEAGEPIYTVRMTDGSQREAEPDDIIRAKTYAEWVAPGTDWSGAEHRKEERRVEERRIRERRSHERAALGRRIAERRKRERRRP